MNICHLYTLEGKFHIIYSFGKHPHAIFDMGTFFKRLLIIPIHKYTYFERNLFATHSHFARYFYAIYSHTLQGISVLHIFTYIHTVERYSPCYLGARYSSWGSQIYILIKDPQTCPNNQAFFTFKTKNLDSQA